MAYRVVETLGACCSSCAQGGSCAVGGLMPSSTNEKHAAIVIGVLALGFILYRRRRGKR